MLSYNQARKISRTRDKDTCICCGKRGGRLTSHHVYPKSKFPHLYNSPDNLVTLCVACHRRFHDKYCNSINGANLDKLVSYLWKYAKDKSVIQNIIGRFVK